MSEFQVAYIPVGVPTFHIESAQAEFEKSKELISGLTAHGVYPEKMLLSIEDLCAYLDTINPSLIILQNITFANSAYPSEVLKRFSCPVLLWTLREPVIDGGRLRLNSLTGAYSAGNSLMSFRDGNFEYIFGGTDEQKVISKINATIQAAKLKTELGSLKLASVGHTPQGFGFGRALDIDMLKVFGVTLESIEARELINKAIGFTDEECESFLQETKEHTVGLDATPEKNRKDFARLYKAYKDYVTENKIGALSSRCWPDFFTAFGTPVCTVLAMLNDLGIPASCEADAYGALSMYMGTQLTGAPVFFGDPVSLDEEENTITFWHCGTAACSLANPDTGAQVGVHPNRKLGPTMEFGCKPCEKVTVFRIGRKADGAFRFFLLSGEALDKPKQFSGTSIVVKTEAPSDEIVCRSVKEGWEPHFIVIYGDVKEQLEVLAHMLGIEVCKY
ncbi:fucose isomerase [Anaerobium acetethylicum]|nr:fucose isomerase [Anaerobium acetethylicum]